MYLAAPKHLSVLGRFDALLINLAQRTVTKYYKICIHVTTLILVDVGATMDHWLS